MVTSLTNCWYELSNSPFHYLFPVHYLHALIRLYIRKLSRLLASPPLIWAFYSPFSKVVLGPHENFNVLSLSGKSICLCFMWNSRFPSRFLEWSPSFEFLIPSFLSFDLHIEVVRPFHRLTFNAFVDFNDQMRWFVFSFQTSCSVSTCWMKTRQPSYSFFKLFSSAGKPKKPNALKTICLMLGPDFITDIIEVGTFVSPRPSYLFRMTIK